MALELYSQGLIFAQGILVAESVSFTMAAATNDQPVVTQAKGFSGITVGASTTDVSIKSAIPKAGFEVNWHKWMKERTVIEITGWRGATKQNIKGFIKSIDESHAVNTSSEANISLHCGEPD